jgi:hypothetical protein
MAQYYPRGLKHDPSIDLNNLRLLFDILTMAGMPKVYAVAQDNAGGNIKRRKDQYE